MYNFIKLILVLLDLSFKSFMAFFPFCKEMINKFLTKKCFICGSTIYNKNKTYKDFKKLFYITYKKNICLDCFIKKHNLEYILENTNIVTCTCGKKETFIHKLKNMWLIQCENCNRKIINNTLNNCLLLWDNDI